jgi:hypothetical protein
MLRKGPFIGKRRLPPKSGVFRMLPADALAPLALFAALVLTLTLQALAGSGQFPREHRAPALATALGEIILYGSIAVAIICLLVAASAAWRLIPWYAAVIGGGFAVLAGPIVLQRFPDRFVDGYAALITFAGASTLLALLLAVLAFNSAAQP